MLIVKNGMNQGVNIEKKIKRELMLKIENMLKNIEILGAFMLKDILVSLKIFCGVRNIWNIGTFSAGRNLREFLNHQNVLFVKENQMAIGRVKGEWLLTTIIKPGKFVGGFVMIVMLLWGG